ncbi:MAG: dTDP-4-dehydrorhamnose reductase [Phycisphaerae bacterium]|nr:dTDP-4-dehydrorhamnose reductase [Phycisphaerae bacterium]
MKLAVIGSAGQVGQEFRKVLSPTQWIPLTRADLDITDAASVERCLSSMDADVIINLAAFHDVNGCEDDGNRAFAVNALGALNVARAAAVGGRKIVYFSSDYVFGQQSNRKEPYLEDDIVGPVNVYGVSKVAGEQCVRMTAENHLIVRSSSLFGAVTSKKGWTFPEMILRKAKAGDPLKVVNDQYMSPTYTLDLVRTVIQLLQRGATGTVHVANADGCTWYDFATATLELAGVKHAIEPVSSAAFPSRARRPVYSRLDSGRIDDLGVNGLRHWRDALGAYLEEKGLRAG